MQAKSPRSRTPIAVTKRRILRYAAVCFLCFPMGCGQFPQTAFRPDEEPEEFPILWERSGRYCDFTTPTRLVARNRAEMANCPISDVPVDFDKEMVLSVTLGRVFTDRLAIRIERVWREGSRIRVDVQTHKYGQPDREQIRMSCPYHVVVVPRSDLNVADGFSPTPERSRSKIRRALPLGL